jgi:hypothetical protein
LADGVDLAVEHFAGLNEFGREVVELIFRNESAASGFLQSRSGFLERAAGVVAELSVFAVVVASVAFAEVGCDRVGRFCDLFADRVFCEGRLVFSDGPNGFGQAHCSFVHRQVVDIHGGSAFFGGHALNRHLQGGEDNVSCFGLRFGVNP